MPKRLPFPILCAAAIATMFVTPTGVVAQTTTAPPVIEVGLLVNEFAILLDGGVDAAPLIGARTSARLASTVSAELDLRFAASSFSEGLYGVRLRFMPRADASSWYLFGGVGGFFELPHTFSYPAGGGAPAHTYRRGSSIGSPMLLHGGAGWRFAGRRSWSTSIEGEVWTSWDGGAAVGATFAVAYGRRRLDGR